MKRRIGRGEKTGTEQPRLGLCDVDGHIAGQRVGLLAPGGGFVRDDGPYGGQLFLQRRIHHVSRLHVVLRPEVHAVPGFHRANERIPFALLRELRE